jgi:hypothetical protein
MIKVEEIIKDKIDNLWRESTHEVTFNIPPLYIKEIPNTEIVFIGINPSLSDEGKKNLLAESNTTCRSYTLNHDSEDIHNYFKKFQLISKETGLSWGHFDLLYIRETKQEKVKKLLKTQEGIQFLYQQLMISKVILNKLINSDKPKIFVVNNTLAREFLGKDRPKDYCEGLEHWMNYKFKWNEKLGTYTYNKCPFFFSSMLTGQRALDIGSLERLIWHIKHVKKQM